MTRAPWFDALIEPSALFVLATAVVAGLIAAWWLFPLGVLLWLFLFLRILRDPAMRLNQMVQDRKDLAQRFETPFSRIQRIQVNIFNNIQSSPPRVRQALQLVQAAVDRKVALSYLACKRLSLLENYRVVASNKSDLQKELEKVQALVTTANDPTTKMQYEETVQSVQARITQYQEAVQQLERFDAQLTSFEHDMQVVFTEVIQLQSEEPGILRQHARALAKRIGDTVGITG